jgi:DNA-binding transcriptional ArsR family regulator
MVESIPAPDLDAVFRALADPTRRDMLRSLSQGDLTIGELAAPLRMSFAGASKHVQALERAGLIQRSIRGRNHVCSLNPEPMAEAMQWLRFYERFWSDKLDALETALLANPRPTPQTGESHE